ncbi:hypothetical protein PHLGIDRAFT_121456 [Phlebiopsis gigantea 11061_1 CR5-6]|uniref:Uncharacterized protein n=1 Tax=Phlebiopsis gigantea (strain 11061_1 CR5-6) TaxID=745531 RepID=A0A0C3NFR0_PHLG1|nr:hypothetical protein PHLGIDRAFT_121456 [Phlebiopsis gigantea 11061_1 CR5-6]
MSAVMEGRARRERRPMHAIFARSGQDASTALATSIARSRPRPPASSSRGSFLRRRPCAGADPAGALDDRCNRWRTAGVEPLHLSTPSARTPEAAARELGGRVYSWPRKGGLLRQKGRVPTAESPQVAAPTRAEGLLPPRFP